MAAISPIVLILLLILFLRKRHRWSFVLKVFVLLVIFLHGAMVLFYGVRIVNYAYKENLYQAKQYNLLQKIPFDLYVPKDKYDRKYIDKLEVINFYKDIYIMYNNVFLSKNTGNFPMLCPYLKESYLWGKYVFPYQYVPYNPKKKSINMKDCVFIGISDNGYEVYESKIGIYSTRHVYSANINGTIVSFFGDGRSSKSEIIDFYNSLVPVTYDGLWGSWHKSIFRLLLDGYSSTWE